MSGVLLSARRYLINSRMQALSQNNNAFNSFTFNPARSVHSGEEESQKKENVFSMAADELKTTGKEANDGLNKAGVEIEKVYSNMANGLLKIAPAFQKMEKDIQSHSTTISEQAKELGVQKLARESDLKRYEEDLRRLKADLEVRKSEFKNFQFGFYAFSAVYLVGAVIGSYVLTRAKQGLNDAKENFKEAQQEIYTILERLSEIRKEMAGIQQQVMEITHEDNLQKIADLEKKLLEARAKFDDLNERAKLLDQFVKNQENAKGQYSIQGIREEFEKTHQELLMLVNQAKKDIAEERNRALQTVEKANPAIFREHLLAEIDKETSRLQVRWNASFSSYRLVGFLGLSRGPSHQYKLRALEALRAEIMESKEEVEFQCSDNTRKLLIEAYEYWPEQEDIQFKQKFIDIHLKNRLPTTPMTPKR